MTAVPVLLYHAVGEPQDPWTVTPARFAEDVVLLRDSGRTPLTVGAYVARQRAGQSLEDLVVVSFDDGDASNLRSAELLAEAGIPCTVYVTASFVDTDGMLTTGQLRELSQVPGVEIGSHAHHHVRLDELSRPALVTELRDSRARLEDVVQAKVVGVAYPHGSYDRRVTSEAKSAGYTSGAGVKNALSHERDDPMAVARMTLTTPTTAADVAALLRGEGRLGEVRPRARTVGWRLVRRARARARVLR
jgi:peptidoglycan/xylan/chitin deacetylase (PgdA/CDA1 family)